MAELIPLFPLGAVLLPGMPLPLRIFEPRYRTLLADISAGPDSGSFGVVALRSGAEARHPQVREQDPDVEPVGTIAEIVQVEPRADGTYQVLAVGSRRFRVIALAPEGRPYLRAEVDYLDELDGPLRAEQVTRARELIEVYDDALRRLAGRATGAELARDAGQLAYQIAARLPLAPADRQRVLADTSTAERLTRLSGLLRRELVLLQRSRSIAVSPGTLRVVASSN